MTDAKTPYSVVLQGGLWAVIRPDGSTLTRTSEGMALFLVAALNAEALRAEGLPR